MLSFGFSSRLTQKSKPFLGLVIFQRFSSLKITEKRKPASKFNRRVSRKPSSVDKAEKPQLYASDKIRIIYNILKYSPWDSAHEQLEKLDVKWDSFTVTQVLKAHPPMEKAWLFFNWASMKRNLKHDHYTCTTMMDIFGEAKRLASMMHVFDLMKEKKMKVDVVTYTSLMHWTSHAGDVDGAVKLWEDMKEKKLRPTVVSYTAYIKILLHHNRVKEASCVYKEMIGSGISPNRYTYTVLMEYLVSSGKFGEAMEIFDQMQETGEEPDKAACNSLIELLSEAGETMAITRILHYMREKFLVLRYPVYRKALEALQTAGVSLALLRQVNRHIAEESKEIDKSDPAFEMENGIAWNLLNKGDVVSLNSLLVEFMEKNVGLEAKLVSKIIEANVSLQRQKGAVLAYEYSLKLGIDVEKAAFLSLLGFSIRANSLGQVMEILDSMVQKGHSLGTQMNCLVIHRLGYAGNAASAARFFDLLPRQGRTSAEYTALMSAFFASGNADLGVETFERMKLESVDIARGTHRVLLDGLERCGRVREMRVYRRSGCKISQRFSVEIGICNLLFAGDFISINGA